jgi:hypothetical protein
MNVDVTHAYWYVHVLESQAAGGAARSVVVDASSARLRISFINIHRYLVSSALLYSSDLTSSGPRKNVS